MDKGMSQQESYAKLFTNYWRRKNPKKEQLN